MAERPEVLILRHGQTEWNAAGRYQGSRDSPLTTLGRDQARAQGAILAALGARLRGFDLRVSPQGRALETAALALAPLGLTARPDPRLREIAVGAWEGLTRAEIAARYPLQDDDHFWWMDAAPGGEGHDAVAARSAELLAGLTGPTLLFTHGMTAGHLRAALRGLSRSALAGLDHRQGVVWRIAGGREEIWSSPGQAG